MMSRDHFIVRRIEMIERDLDEVKRLVSSGEGGNIALRGIWRGMDIPDEDVEEAKRSLFKGIDIDDAD